MKPCTGTLTHDAGECPACITRERDNFREHWRTWKLRAEALREDFESVLNERNAVLASAATAEALRDRAEAAERRAADLEIIAEAAEKMRDESDALLHEAREALARQAFVDDAGDGSGLPCFCFDASGFHDPPKHCPGCSLARAFLNKLDARGGE